MGSIIPIYARAVPASQAVAPTSTIPVGVVFVDGSGQPVDIGGAPLVPAAAVAKAAGASPTKAEFDALIDALTAAGLMEAAGSGA